MKVMEYFWTLIIIMYFKTGLIHSGCQIQDCHTTTDWKDKLFCESSFGHRMIKHVNCSWLPYSSSSNITKYILHLKRPEKSSCQVIETTNTYVKLGMNKLRQDKKAIIWVSYNSSPESCLKTKEFHIVPKENCRNPKFIRAVHSGNVLQLQLDKFGEIRYREKTTNLWHTVNETKTQLSINVSEYSTHSNFVVQQRCKSAYCFHCEWGAETHVAHVLTEAPSITVTAKAIDPGKQRVTVEWEYMQKEHVTGYIVNISRIPDSCRTCNESYKLSDTQFHVNLSLAYYKIWVAAENSAGFSPATSVMVPVLPRTEFNGKIFATVQKNNNIFLTWSPDIECDFFIINWGTNSSNMETRAVMGKQDNYSLTGPFEKWKKYIITIHLYPEMCFCGSFTRESTFGMTYIYAEESVPNAGPSNITIRNISKHSADINWEEIPEKDRFGFLVGYKMYYTDMSQNKTLDVMVNSTSETSWQLTGLARGIKYEIKISGLTKKGEGILSAPYVFQTLLYDEGEFRMIVVLSCLGIIIIILLSASVCACVLRRTKRWYFPKVPNPKHSNITKINEEISTKSVPRFLAPQDEHDGDSAHFEVIEVSSMAVSILDESADEVDVSSIHETQTPFLKTNCQPSPCGKETPTTLGPASHDYIGTKAVCKPAQRSPRTMYEIGRPQHMPADVTKKKTVLSFSDYIRENQSMN